MQFIIHFQFEPFYSSKTALRCIVVLLRYLMLYHGDLKNAHDISFFIIKPLYESALRNLFSLSVFKCFTHDGCSVAQANNSLNVALIRMAI